ncbi:hypothetical protein LCD36_04660 [Saccharopolyspora sp. 6T]|uniref:hypothetical protein n=1 Tax=Saccharopolyspora sp. 6T TaxID=2877238 RepID=UPI001CD4EBFA|nr:hypothetical protein [Saccharopolyspora sp. 6T]MCA1185744.1 hypothetical protein [Saccharopolyspora sp. 6T]
MITKHTHQEWAELTKKLTANGHQKAADYTTELHSYLDVVPADTVAIADALFEHLAIPEALDVVELSLEAIRGEAQAIREGSV